ncbi:MAG: alpha/beta fold hydrolase [Betaproteobacteria bacterium]|nr:alpha/beta fold hydrolase [Betaproteobacteria bacterium]
MNFSKDSLNVAGCRVNVLRGGEGAPLLVLHGMEGGGRWLPYMDDLAGNHQVIAPEHPGFGHSDSPDWLESVVDLAQFYQEFLQAQGLEGVHVLGNCLGGWIAMEMAVACSHRLTSLILSAPPGIQVKGVSKADLFIIPPAEAARLCFHDKALGESAAAEVANAKDAELDLHLKNRAMLARLAWQPYFYRPALRKWLHRITIPTRILWGREDRFLSTAHAGPLAELIPGARVSVLPECGHFPFIEQRSAFVGRVNTLHSEQAR